MTQTDMNSQNGDEFHGGFHTMGSVSVKKSPSKPTQTSDSEARSWIT